MSYNLIRRNLFPRPFLYVSGLPRFKARNGTVVSRLPKCFLDIKIETAALEKNRRNATAVQNLRWKKDETLTTPPHSEFEVTSVTEPAQSVQATVC